MKVIFTELLPSGERQQLATVDLPCLPERGDFVSLTSGVYKVNVRRWFVHPGDTAPPVVLIECQKA